MAEKQTTEQKATAKEEKAEEKAIAKQAKAVAKEQDELDARAVMRSSYNSGDGSGGRFDSGYEYDRKA